MKFIKTYWHGVENSFDKVYNPKIKREPLYQFVLSSLLLMQHHPAEVYTDLEGFEIITELNIPFKKIHVIPRQSSKYRSLNDLYALSLQNSPSTLVADDVLVMEKLKISSKNSVVTFMGTDLNSVKLVKAIIKIYRITTDIPYLNDSYWTNKEAYIDAAILSIPANSIIKGYISEVKRFVEEYSDHLSGIDNFVIDDFLKRYWLYSYLNQKGYKIQLLIKDTIIGVSADAFGFSKKNIFGGVLKIGDFDYLNLEFSLHFFQFFQLRFPEIFKTVQTYLNKNDVLSSPANDFIRVEEFLKKNYPSIELEKYKGTAKSIRSLIKGLQPPDIFINDIFKYENFLRAVNKASTKSMHEISLQQQHAFNRIVQNWDINDAEFKKLKIAVNPHAYFHESKWKWSTLWVDGVSKETIARLKVAHNFLNAPGCYITAFLPQVEGKVYEFDIDKFSAEIISHFFNNGIISDFLKCIINDKNHSQRKDIGPLTMFYFNRIRDLIKINILCIANE